jgi:hypothetical protein
MGYTNVSVVDSRLLEGRRKSWTVAKHMFFARIE